MYLSREVAQKLFGDGSVSIAIRRADRKICVYTCFRGIVKFAKSFIVTSAAIFFAITKRKLHFATLILFPVCRFAEGPIVLDGNLSFIRSSNTIDYPIATSMRVIAWLIIALSLIGICFIVGKFIEKLSESILKHHPIPEDPTDYLYIGSVHVPRIRVTKKIETTTDYSFE